MMSLALWLIANGSGAAAAPPTLTVPVHDQVTPDSPPTVVLRAGRETVATVWLSYDSDHLYIRFRVSDRSPLQNAAVDWKLLFKTGDSVDLQLGLDPDARADRTEPLEGDVRVLMTEASDGPVAISYHYRVPGADHPERFGSPTGSVTVDRVERLAGARLEVKRTGDGYELQAALPWSAMAGKPFTPQPGRTLRGDVGVLFSDPSGQATVERVYWSNQATTTVADVPSEIRLHPARWGDFSLGE